MDKGKRRWQTKYAGEKGRGHLWMDGLHLHEESASQEVLPQEAKAASHKNTPSPVSLGQSS